MKSLFIKNIPSELGRRLKVASIHGEVSIRDMVLVAVEEYLDRRVKKPTLTPISMPLPSPAVIKLIQERDTGNILPGGIIETDSIEVNETLENVPPMKIEMEGGAIIEFHNNGKDTEKFTGCSTWSDGIDEMNEIEFDNTVPEDEPKAHDEVTEPVKFKKTW